MIKFNRKDNLKYIAVSSHMTNHPNGNIGANEHDYFKLYNLFRNRCKIYKV